MPTSFYSRIPSAAVKSYFDGNQYAHIPHQLVGGKEIKEDYDNPRLVRYDSSCFIENGEAYIFFGRIGDALPLPIHIPFGVTAK